MYDSDKFGMAKSFYDDNGRKAAGFAALVSESGLEMHATCKARQSLQPNQQAYRQRNCRSWPIRYASVVQNPFNSKMPKTQKRKVAWVWARSIIVKQNRKGKMMFALISAIAEIISISQYNIIWTLMHRFWKEKKASTIFLAEPESYHQATNDYPYSAQSASVFSNKIYQQPSDFPSRNSAESTVGSALKLKSAISPAVIWSFVTL